MDFIQLLHNRLITHNILEHLNPEDRRILFFSSLQLQQVLAKFKQMHAHAGTVKQAHMTYYFPKHSYGKHEKRYAERRNITNYMTNALATKIPCQECGIYFYNVEYETNIKQCEDHKHYSYSGTEMKVKRRGQDLFGKYWISKEIYRPIAPARALCYCNTCKRFLHYAPIETGFKLTTCIDCLQIEHNRDRLHQRTTYSIKLENSYAFYVKSYYFQITPLQLALQQPISSPHPIL